ncbi:MAG: hypothetical protein ACK5MT_00230 [Actinomycetales bacterium]
MTPDEEDFLTLLHQNLEQRELRPDDPRYVSVTDHAAAFGPDVILELSRELSRSSVGAMAFLTGTRGSGKSTQLLRLKQQLTERGFAVAYVDLEDYLNLRQPLEITELLYGMVGAISDAIAQERWIPTEDAIALGWGRLADWLRNQLSRITLTPEAEASLGVDLPGLMTGKVSVKAELRQDESFVAAMNRYLQGRTSELARAANEAVDAMVDRLRTASDTRGETWKGLIVLFDSLDHVRGTDFTHVRRALQEVFDRHARTVRLTGARTVFVVPQWLHLEETVRRVVNVKVHDRSGECFEPGIDALVEIVRRRVPEGSLDRLFPDPDQLRDFVADSGGHLRDLLRLVRNAETSAVALPFDGPLLHRARQLERERMTPIADDERACLRHVRATHHVPLPSQDEWEALAGLFDRHLILGYLNGQLWYGVHPLIVDEIDQPAVR